MNRSFTPPDQNRALLTSGAVSIVLVWMLALAVLPTALQADQVIATYSLPYNSSGLAWDGRILWVGGVGERGNWIRAYNPEEDTFVDSLRAPVPDCLGLAFSEGQLIYLSPRSDSTYFIQRDGRYSAILNPYQHMAGVAVENGALWGAVYFNPNGVLVKFDRQGRVLTTVPHSGRQSRDMTLFKGSLYIADLVSQGVRVVTPSTGRLNRLLTAYGSNPDGVTNDETSLYVLTDGVDKSDDRLTRLTVQAEGGVRLSTLYHNYGSVVIDDERGWTLWVYNDGAQAAELIDIETADGNPNIFIAEHWRFPQRIAPGDSAGLTITFSPAWVDSVHIRFGLTFDLDRVTNWVDLRGKGVRRQRDIIVPNRAIDFGVVYSGQFVRSSGMRTLFIENNGGEPLTIQSMIFGDDEFTFGYYQLPVTLREPGLYRIPIFFRPRAAGRFNSTLTIFSDDPDSARITVRLSGMSESRNYPGGALLWSTEVGTNNLPGQTVRAILDISDITSDNLADVVIAGNDYKIESFHAASSQSSTRVWTYRTDLNPWRSGLVPGPRAISGGEDWDNDRIGEVVVGLGGRALSVVTLSGRTGQELRVFDTHHLPGGGGEVKIVQAYHDLTGDRVRDIFAGCAAVSEVNATNGAFVINGRTGQLAWFTPTTGRVRDIFEIGDVSGDEVVDLVVVCENGDVLALDGARGRLLWEASVFGTICSQFAISDVNRDGSRDVTIVTTASGISMFNGSNGVRLWLAGAGVRAFEQINNAVPMDDVNGNGSHDIAVGDGVAFARAIDGRTGAAVWDTTINLGSACWSIATMQDIDNDGKRDLLFGTSVGRLYAISASGRNGLWSYSNVQEGHGFRIVTATRDLDGNGQTDVVAGMENGSVYCFAGSYVGLAVPDVEQTPLQPQTVLLNPAWPNPFNGSVNLPLFLAAPAPAELRIFDLAGREVYRYGPILLTTGEHRLTWPGVTKAGLPAASGFYLVRLTANGSEVVRSIELMR